MKTIKYNKDDVYIFEIDTDNLREMAHINKYLKENLPEDMNMLILNKRYVELIKLEKEE